MDNSWIHMFPYIIVVGSFLVVWQALFVNARPGLFQIPVIDGYPHPRVFHYLYIALFFFALFLTVGACIAMDVMLLLGVS